MIERYHIKERNDITQPREEKRKTNRGIDPNIFFLFTLADTTIINTMNNITNTTNNNNTNTIMTCITITTLTIRTIVVPITALATFRASSTTTT
jgi:Mg2+ and Co2+ transporter CorA